MMSRIHCFVIVLCIASSKCNSENLVDPDEDFELDEADISRVLKEDLKSKQLDKKASTNTQQDSSATNSDLDTNAFWKPKPKLDISEEVIQKAVAAARAEIEQENQQNKAEDTSKRSGHVTYQGMHYRARPNPEAELQGHHAKILERTVKKIADAHGLSSADAVKQLSGLQSDDIKRSICKTTESQVRCNPYNRYRTITGVCNNIYRPHLGAANTPLKRLLLPDYADGLKTPRRSHYGCNLPNARNFSRNAFTDLNLPSKRISHLLMIWGQFLDHDITLGQQPKNLECPSGNMSCTHRGECFGIRVHRDDPDFRNTKCIQMKRDVPVPNRGCQFGPRQQVNTITAFIDASQVYGSTAEILNDTRNLTSSSGLLKVSKFMPRVDLKSLLPSAHPEEFCRTSDNATMPCFLAGDERVNENQGLASIHTLFMREHNRIAKKLRKFYSRWSSDQIFQETRKIVGAIMQHITYNEFLPIVLNRATRWRFGLYLRYYRGYNVFVDPSIANSFAGAAFRFGHSLVRNDFSRFGKNSQTFSSLETKNIFFNPDSLYDSSKGGVDSIIRGLTKDPAQGFDRHFVKAVTANLIVAPRIIIDLPATNIQRGREHGLPGYNQFRRFCGLKKAKDFCDLREFSYTNRRLLEVNYRHVDDIDLFAGGVLEKPMPGALVGPTFSCLIAKQFHDLRRGDRFWYERHNGFTGFSYRQLRQLRKVSLARILCDNADDITHIQPRVMQLANRRWNRLKRCSQIPQIDFRQWY